MKLKIKIKEVKKEWRQLTELETLLTDISRLNQVPESYKDKLKWQLKLRGITGYDISSERILGLFRTETIRDATPKEIIAWHCLESYKECDRVDDTCYACPLNVIGGICVPRKCEERSKKVLEGKEVILELV